MEEIEGALIDIILNDADQELLCDVNDIQLQEAIEKIEMAIRNIREQHAELRS